MLNLGKVQSFMLESVEFLNEQLGFHRGLAEIADQSKATVSEITGGKTEHALALPKASKVGGVRTRYAKKKSLATPRKARTTKRIAIKAIRVNQPATTPGSHSFRDKILGNLARATARNPIPDSVLRKELGVTDENSRFYRRSLTALVTSGDIHESKDGYWK
jgi:hypothetical protein